MTFDPEHKGCQATIGRLSVELAREITKTSILAQAVVDLYDRLDRLSHEQAIDSGQTLPAEAAQYLADQEGGS